MVILRSYGTADEELYTLMVTAVTELADPFGASKAKFRQAGCCDGKLDIGE